MKKTPNVSKPLKRSKNADIAFLLLFIKSQRNDKFQKHSLGVQALKIW